jgi:hypothetical protein
MEVGTARLELLPEPDRPTFIGHYWFDPRERPAPAARRVACVDYSAGRGGPLTAYRFKGEPELTADRFVAVGGAADGAGRRG